MPPGKYPLVKALCDSDFDGCVCAAILKTVYPDLQLFFSDPGKVQAGNLNDWVDTQTVIADLPYISGCGIYFDHHIGNKPQQAHPGRWENSPSAAEILYRYYQAYPGIAKFSCVIAELGRFDSGNVTLADIKNPSSYFNIGFAIGSLFLVEPGVYLSMNGRLFSAGEAMKNVEIGRFEER